MDKSKKEIGQYKRWLNANVILFSSHPSPHPVVILPSSIRPSHLQHVLHFIYRGEVQVSTCTLCTILDIQRRSTG